MFFFKMNLLQRCQKVSVAVPRENQYCTNKVSTQISLSMPRRLTRIDLFFTSCGYSVSGIITLYLYSPETEWLARISLRRLIWIDTLSRGHNVGFSRGTAQM